MVKRISILKRLTIIRRVTEVIEEITIAPEFNFKKLVKILNLCHIYVPVSTTKANNSTDMSLDARDLLEMTRDKDRYRVFVERQRQSLEAMIRGFRVPYTVPNFFLLLTRYMLDKCTY